MGNLGAHHDLASHASAQGAMCDWLLQHRTARARSASGHCSGDLDEFLSIPKEQRKQSNVRRLLTWILCSAIGQRMSFFCP